MRTAFAPTKMPGTATGTNQLDARFVKSLAKSAIDVVRLPPAGGYFKIRCALQHPS
jgi:hypothetical protein